MKRTAPQVALCRHEYGDCGLFEGDFFACNGSVAVKVRPYFDDARLVEIGAALTTFPRRTPDRCEFTLGELDPTGWFFLLGAYTVGRLGQCAVKVKVNNNREEPGEKIVELSIQAEAAAINRLGSLLISFANDKSKTFLRWDLSSGELLDHIPSEVAVL